MKQYDLLLKTFFWLEYLNDVDKNQGDLLKLLNLKKEKQNQNKKKRKRDAPVSINAL